MPPRIHEAAATPCSRCGAALPVDPTAAHVFCGACHAWQPVPPELVQRAWQQAHARAAAAAEAQRARVHAAKQSSRATLERLQGFAALGVLAVMLLVSVGGFVPTVVVYGIAIPIVIVEELEPWAAALALSTMGLSLGTVLAAIGGGGWLLRRRFTRRRRWRRAARSDEWYGGARAPVSVCGECGAPVAFAPGEQVVCCGHCRSVVAAGSEHTGELIQLALSDVQRARRERAKADRALLRTRTLAQRKTAALRMYVTLGSMACLMLPALAALYAWRALTPSLEEALELLARRLRAELAAGLDAAFGWLDTFWLGDTPPGFEPESWLGSRWSIAGVFHDRPVLLSVVATWSDRVAESATLLLTRPRQRDPARVAAAPAAARVRALGWQIYCDYAGIALCARGLRERQLSEAVVTDLARAAYELAEEP